MSIETGPEAPPRKEKALTIGAVCKQLEREFPDISISKIRYLEDQKLLAPRRTPGGYRLYSGGGRVGQSFPMAGEKMTIGRSPETDVFLDDVTVSREHATLVRRGGDWFLDDAGSLNGTYVNRQRVDSHRLEDGDELQIGKFKLTFFAR